MEKIKIAHLSDLHCDSSDEWTDNFSYITECLTEIKPDLIIITGDSVDQPTKNNFKCLASNIKKITDNSELPRHLHILPVPGNHDYFLFGNILFNFSLWNRKLLFDKYLKKMIHPFDNYHDTIKSLYNKYNIAFFPLDSNESKYKFAFAQGYLINPLQSLKKYDEIFQKISKKEGISYSNSTKIILLHHHPLPIATPKRKEHLEKFLVLRNSYQFLEACRLINANIILHGHKHISNIMNYEFLGRENRKITICSCSSSGKTNHPHKEIKNILISKSGTVAVNSYFSKNESRIFTKEEMLHSSNYYGDIRKLRHNSVPYIEDGKKCPIDQITNKTKIISLSSASYGIDYVSITCSNITWKQEIDHTEKKIKEQVRADLGRVAGGRYGFSSCPIQNTAQLQTWHKPGLENGVNSDTETPDLFVKEFTPVNPLRGESKDCFRMEYVTFSGFALTEREHKEKYALEKDELHLENASISTNYPTYMLELIVRFPKDFFPPLDSFYVEASFKGNPTDPNLNILKRKNEIHSEETKFLEEKGAVRIRSELNEVSVIIKYPQPDLDYVLRWQVPTLDKREIDGTAGSSRKLCQTLGNLLLATQETDFAVDLYRILTNKIKQLFPNTNYHVFLFGYNFTKKTLEISRCPEEYAEKITGALLVGRGPAGRAFKYRRAFYWESGKGILGEHGLSPQPIEGIIKGFVPVKVIAMPLCCPEFISDDGNVGTAEKYICPAWGALSIATDVEQSYSYLEEETARKKRDQLVDIFKQLNQTIKQYSKSYLQEQSATK